MENIINNIEFEVEYGADYNEEFKNADGWTCTFYYNGEEESFPFYMGVGHKGREPEMIEVLDCLFRDGEALDMTFSDWCNYCGYDNDSIRALKTFEECQKIGIKLKGLFGEDYNIISEEIMDLAS